MKKKLLSLFAAVLVLSAFCAVMLTGCGADSSSANANSPSLYAQGKQTISLLYDMLKSDEYLGMVTADKSVKEQIKTNAAGDYSEATACYDIILTEEQLDTLTSDTKFNDLPAQLQSYFKNRIVSSVATRINAQSGTSAVAAASVCTAGRLFVNKAVQRPALYLYTFSDTAPVLVAFVPGEDGAVSATAIPVLSPDFKSVASAEDVQTAFEKILPGCTVQSVPMT